MDRITPEVIDKLPKGFIFVFGSNEMGIHGAGAAKLAMDKFRAKLGVGFGMTGSCFAIPTKDWEIIPLPLSAIEHYISRYVAYVKRKISNPWNYYVTRIGCGLAGFTPEQIAPMFKDLRHQKNVWLPQEFIDIIDKNFIEDHDRDNLVSLDR